MPEELRIVVVDQGGAAPSRGAAAPAGGPVPRGPIAPGDGLGLFVPGGGRRPRGPVVPRSPEEQVALANRAKRQRARLLGEEEKILKAEQAARTAKFSSAVGTAGGIAGAAAAGNVAGAASRGAAGIVAAVGGPVGVVVAAVTAGFGVAAIAARKFAQVVESQTNKLAGFSAPLSAAQAQTEITRELALMRRAQRIGPELAAAERLRSKFEDAMTDLGTEILGVLLQLLEAATPFIEVGIKVMTIVANFLERWGDTIAKAMIVLARMSSMVQILEAVFRVLEKMFDTIVPDPDPMVDPFTTAFMNLLPRNARGQREFFQPRPGV